MKKIIAAIMCTGILFFSTSCTVLIFKHDNGKHKGWYKNPNNPHNPAHGNNPNPGNSNPGNPQPGKSHGKGKK